METSTSSASDDSRSFKGDGYDVNPSEITPDYVRNMKSASDRLFCLLKHNDLIRFGHYQIKDYDSGTILMDISEDQQNYADSIAR